MPIGNIPQAVLYFKELALLAVQLNNGFVSLSWMEVVEHTGESDQASDRWKVTGWLEPRTATANLSLA